MTPLPPRACARCWEVKPADDFPLGPSGRRRRGVCEDCLERAASESRARVERRRTTRIDARGRRWRLCRPCGGEYLLEDGFYPSQRDKQSGEIVEYDFRCKQCQTTRVVAANAKRVREDREFAARRRASKQRWRERNREADLEANRRYRERVYADAQRHARQLESARIAHRLRREREGLPVRGGMSNAILPTDAVSGRLPVAPLLVAVDRWLNGRDYEEVNAFIDPRNLRGWRSGESPSTTFDVADRVLVGLGLLWWEVWREGVEGHERACELFTGRAVAA